MQGFKINETTDGTLNQTGSSVVYKEFFMDTKINKAESFKKASALKAKNIIDKWQPDLVIASDDNAVKYLVEKYLNDIDMPVLFMGVNGSLKNYNLATNNNITCSQNIAIS